MSAQGAEVWFYRLERDRVEQALPPLVAKCLSRGWQVGICAPSLARIEAIDASLWTTGEDSFLPHARAGAGLPGGDVRQPVLLASHLEQLAGRQALFLVDNAEPGDLAGIARAFVVFDGRDEQAVQAARVRWAGLKPLGLALSYWRQSPQGTWEKQA